MTNEILSDPLKLEYGRLTARPGPDIHLYAFRCETVPLPEIGQRGLFVHGPDSITARVADRHGPQLTLCLQSDKTLGANISGHFEAEPPVAAPEPRFDESLQLPAGARQFLDPRDGWVMEVTEAASQKKAADETGNWPVAALSELPHRLSPAGLTFVWRQSPDPATGLEVRMAEYLASFGRVLVLGDSPADLEPLAELPEAFFIGPAAPGTPLHPISLHTKMAEARRAAEIAQAELRNQLSDLKRAESALKAELNNWDDLAGLEKRFKEMGRDVEARKRHWGLTRQNLESARKAWEEAGLAADKNARGGLLGFLKKSGPSERALRLESDRRQVLDEAEKRAAEVRREEESVLEKALNLEKRLSAARLDSQSWKSSDDLKRRLADLREKEAAMHARMAAAAARPTPGPDEFLQAPLVLALTADLAPGGVLHGARFASVMALCSAPPDHAGRLHLASLALAAEEHLLVMGDFTFWPVWRAEAPALEGRPDAGAWAGLILAEEADDFKQYLASGAPFLPEAVPFSQGPVLSRLEPGPEWTEFEAATFNYIVQPAGTAAAPQGEAANPLPAGPLRRKKRVTSAVPAFGLGLRAFGEIGPANPVSALMAARAAMNAEKDIAGHEPAVIILTASPAQSRLVSEVLKDLEAPPGRIFCGEPQDFRHWPKAPLVILEPAFEAPHTSHPWAWPAFGRQRLSLALNLAEERVWLAGRDDWMRSLPTAAPLSALWRLAAESSPEANPHEPRKGIRPPSFWEALDKAKKEVWAIVPTFEPFWWRPLEEHFLAAARRRVQITILSAPPGPGQDREYPSAAIRTLAAYGCAIHLAKGFPGFMAVVDGCHFTWGHFVEGSQGAHIWGGLKSAELSRAMPVLSEILQMKTITEKLGRKSGGLKNCRVCGWPMVLINEENMRGYGDEQPLKVGCLGEHSGKFQNRRLDEREPFLAPPRCGVDNSTPYQRQGRGRAAIWVCPHHPGGPRCPSYKTVPGDAL